MRQVSGGSGNRAVSIYAGNGEILVNDTDQEYEIHYAYDTTANGRADRIALQPGEAAQCVSKGGSRDFARWEIGSPDEFTGETVNVSFLKRR